MAITTKHKPGPIAGWRMYDKEHKLLQVYLRRLKRRQQTLKGQMPQDGYIEPFIEQPADTKKRKPFIDIKITPEKDEQTDMAMTMNAPSATGECLGGDNPPDDSGSGWGSETYVDENGNTITISVENLEEVVITAPARTETISFSDYPFLTIDNFGEVLNDYTPTDWDSVNEYLSWWEQEFNFDAGSIGVEAITADTSITNHPNVNCVVTNLQNILTNIAGVNNQVTLKVVNNLTNSSGTSIEGNTSSPDGGGSFIIKVNGLNAYDDEYSRIFLASDFIHEAFHVKLMDKMYASYGTTNIGNWTTVPTDPTLLELYNNYQTNLANGINNSGLAQHDWMVQHIDQIANELKSYLEANYQVTAAAIGDNLNAYKAFILTTDGSLRSSSLADAAMNAIGSDSDILSLYSLFSTGNVNGCSN